MSRNVSELYGSFQNATYPTLGMQAPLPIPGVSDPVRIQLLRFLNDSIWFPFLMMCAVAVVTLGLFPGVVDSEVRKTLGLSVRHWPQTVFIVHMSLRQMGRTDG